eukprot:TRINITY_DN13085_c0_g1_i1.p1 TRINITY_DN13085_c0_g1~~TRINITY_DN13085_c0_g1_i1.p1  ORF type:complete len:171 (-),score=25.32 TRINITY_DN13085_c0_g1_i1:176-688(-)
MARYTVVVQQGQDADRVYFVRAGTLTVMKQIEFPQKDAQIVNDLTHGETEWLYLDPEAAERKNFQLLVEDAAGFEMVDTGMERAMKHAKLLEVGEIGPREFFGEIALLKQTNRAASVISKTEVDLLGLGKCSLSSCDHNSYHVSSLSLSLSLSLCLSLHSQKRLCPSYCW